MSEHDQPALDGASPTPLMPPPYVGPRAFKQGEALFGRERELRELRELLIAERVVLLYSPSGAGKTSLVHAALVPALLRRRFRVLPTIRVNQELPAVASPQANRYLYSTLLALEEGLPQDQQVPQQELLEMSLADYLERRVLVDGAPGDPVLIFDQFEEVLTVGPANVAHKQEFFDQLGAALEDRRIWALFAMREDYLAALDPFRRPIPNRLKDTFRLGLLDAASARRAIQAPARAAGVTFADEAVTQLVDDLRSTSVQRLDGTFEDTDGVYVEPVQLQVVCLRLWERLFSGAEDSEKRTISVEDVAAVGDVNSALADYYVDRVRAVVAEAQVRERDVRDWFDERLLTPQGRRGQVMREPAASGGLSNAAISRLIDAHLVRADEHRGAIWYELAHDRLIAPIRLDNEAWRKEHLSLLQRQAELWEDQKRAKSLLLTGKALKEARKWAASHADEVTATEADFLEACRSNQRERRNWLLLWSGIASVVFIALLLITINSTRQARLARALQYAAQARNEGERFAQRGLLLAEEALASSREGDPSLPTVEGSMRDVAALAGGLPLRGHTGAVQDIAYSPNGRWLATVSSDSTVRLWHADAPQLAPRVLRGHTLGVLAVAFSPDSRWLATAGADNTARLWQLDVSDPVSTVLADHKLEVRSLAFSPDGRWLATAGLDDGVRLWRVNAQPGAPIVLPGHTASVNALAFSPDGQRLAAGGADGNARIWDIGGEEQPGSVATIPDTNGGVTSVAFSPDGHWFATGSNDGLTRLWRANALQSEPATFSDLGEPVTAVAFSPDSGWLASGGARGKVAIGRTDDSEHIGLSGHTMAVTAVAFSPDGRWLASGSEDGTAQVWEVDKRQSVPTFVLRGHSSAVRAVAFSPNGRNVTTGSDDSTGRLWQLASPVISPILLRDHDSPVKAIAFSPNSRWLASGSSDGTARMWRADQLTNTIELTGHTQLLTALAFSPNSRWLATGSYDGSARLWEVDRPTAGSRELKGGGAIVWSVVFSPDSYWLAMASFDGTVRLWPTDGRGTPRILQSGEQPLRSVAFSPDGRWLASGSDDGTVRLWQTAALERAPVELPGHTAAVKVAAFSPDSRFLATSSDDTTARLWQLNEPQPSSVALRGHSTSVNVLVFSPDGRWLATGSNDSTLALWRVDAPASDPVVLRGHLNAVFAAAFSLDGRLLVSGSEDTTARIWKVDDAEAAPVVLRGHSGTVEAVAFSPDGRWLATGDNNTVRMWHLRVSELAALMCTSVGRNLELNEWKQLIGDTESYRATCPELPLHETYYQDLLLQGQVDAAVTAYTADQRRDPSLEPPAAWLARQAGAIISRERLEQAFAAYRAARALDDTLRNVSVDSLNALCRFGDDPRYVADALDACNRAVQLDPQYGNLNYNRGLARRTAGDLRGAIEDFQIFIEWAPGRPMAPEKIEQCNQWIAELKEELKLR